MTLAQTACDEKPNEIAAIPEFVKLAHTQGTIITIDAMEAQTATAKQIVDYDWLHGYDGLSSNFKSSFNQPKQCFRLHSESKLDFGPS